MNEVHFKMVSDDLPPTGRRGRYRLKGGTWFEKRSDDGRHHRTGGFPE